MLRIEPDFDGPVPEPRCPCEHCRTEGRSDNHEGCIRTPSE